MKVEFKWHKYPEEKPTEGGKYVLRTASLMNGHDSLNFHAEYEDKRDAFGFYFDSGEWMEAISATEAKRAKRIGVAVYFWSAIPEGIDEVVSRYV